MKGLAAGPILTLIILIQAVGCAPADSTEVRSQDAPTRTFSGLNESFGDYWYQGVAEITSYDLEQARYGETHPGSAVLIYVTEDLSEEKQVKLDDPYGSPDDAVKVLKLNATRKFNTGIYPYSTMSSVFTPVYRDRHPATLKVTTSVQEWCGQTFAQMNRVDDAYRIRHYSYFESDGDGDEVIDDVVLEDELWNIIRLNPDDLPNGPVDVLPSSLNQRLSHSDWSPRSAVAIVEPVENRPELAQFRLTYDEIGRELVVRYRREFPHEIESWEESRGGPASRRLTTRATVKKRITIDYWTRNRPSDAALREMLEL